MAVSGFSEEFFAERFRRPGNLDVLEQQLRDYDLQKTQQTFDKEFVLKNLHFSAKLPEKAATLLKHLIPSILDPPNPQIRHSMTPRRSIWTRVLRVPIDIVNFPV